VSPQFFRVALYGPRLSNSFARPSRFVGHCVHGTDELDAISGIGPARLDTLRDLVAP